ncbi:hypothetical protein GTQ40_08405 [Flavobacteriaceae bacterium R38]|nr:hypothetical protein [Flavobacteriaceae bacterium R38]
MKTSLFLIGFYFIILGCSNDPILTDEISENKIITNSANFSFKIKEKLVLKAYQINQPNLQARQGHTSLVFDNKMWILAGRGKNTVFNDVLSSKDGEKWTTSAIQKNRFPPRYYHASTIFNGKMWIVGGRGTKNDNILNDVWSSSDGIVWELVTSNANFEPRWHHSLTSFNGAMWLIGGATTEAYQSEEVCCGFNDVWRSYDGVNWEKVFDESYGPNAIFGHEAIAFKGKLIAVGGNAYGEAASIRYSTNGMDWNKITLDLEFQHHSLFTDGKKLWVTAGITDEYNNGFPVATNTVWYTKNGLDWFETSTTKKFPERLHHTSLYYNNRFWIINGFNYPDTYYNDVWVLQDPDCCEIDDIQIKN